MSCEHFQHSNHLIIYFLQVLEKLSSEIFSLVLEKIRLTNIQLLSVTLNRDGRKFSYQFITTSQEFYQTHNVQQLVLLLYLRDLFRRAGPAGGADPPPMAARVVAGRGGADRRDGAGAGRVAMKTDGQNPVTARPFSHICPIFRGKRKRDGFFRIRDGKLRERDGIRLKDFPSV
jgi:hypothetical protein